MPRISRIIIANNPHHITQRGNNKIDIFLDDEDKNMFITYLNEWSIRSNMKILAYCLMNNHFHILMEPDKPEMLSQCLHGLSFEYAQYFNRKYKRSGRLWQNRYFSCPVEAGESMFAVARYIENNPVKAGIVKSPEKWEWSSAKTNMQGISNKVKMYTWLSDRKREEYKSYILGQNEQNDIRFSTSSGRPYGTKSYIEKLENLLNKRLTRQKSGRPRKKHIYETKE